MVIIILFVVDDDNDNDDAWGSEKFSSGGLLTKSPNSIPNTDMIESKEIIKLRASSSFYKENSIS